MKIGIFCPVNDQIVAENFEQTEKLIAWCAKNGHPKQEYDNDFME